MASYEQYSTQLAYCMSLYVTKDHSLSTPVLSLSSPHSQIIKGILRYWPTGNSGKEICFISEIDDILQQLQPAGDTPLPRCALPAHREVCEVPQFPGGGAGVEFMAGHGL